MRVNGDRCSGMSLRLVAKKGGISRAGSDFHFVERDDPEKIAATLVKLVQERIPERFGLDPIRDVQVLCPMNRGSLGVRELNTALQRVLNPTHPGQPFVERFGWRFKIGDKVIQTENDYDKDVFNGDVGIVERIDAVEQQVGNRGWRAPRPVTTALRAADRNSAPLLHGSDAGRKPSVNFGSSEILPGTDLGCHRRINLGLSMLKRRFVGRGMHLEFCHPEYSTPIVTSRVQEIRECAERAPVLDQAAQHMVAHKAVH
jgi:hypothetical protein